LGVASVNDADTAIGVLEHVGHRVLRKSRVNYRRQLWPFGSSRNHALGEFPVCKLVLVALGEFMARDGVAFNFWTWSCSDELFQCLMHD